MTRLAQAAGLLTLSICLFLGVHLQCSEGGPVESLIPQLKSKLRDALQWHGFWEGYFDVQNYIPGKKISATALVSESGVIVFLTDIFMIVELQLSVEGSVERTTGTMFLALSRQEAIEHYFNSQHVRAIESGRRAKAGRFNLPGELREPPPVNRRGEYREVTFEVQLPSLDQPGCIQSRQVPAELETFIAVVKQSVREWFQGVTAEATAIIPYFCSADPRVFVVVESRDERGYFIFHRDVSGEWKWSGRKYWSEGKTPARWSQQVRKHSLVQVVLR
jgi:hypothetical protein